MAGLYTLRRLSGDPMLSTQDKTRIDDTRIASVRPLMTPALLD